MQANFRKGLIALGLVLGCFALLRMAPALPPRPAPPPVIAEDKLDRIIDKLDALDQRMQSLERKLDHPVTEPSSLSMDWSEAAAAIVNKIAGGPVLTTTKADRNRRIVELLNDSENLRQIEYEWERIWFTDHPTHLTAERVNGSIQKP
jgi:hypothetical protein